MSTAPAPAPRRFALWKKILLVLAVAVIAFITIVLMQPNEYRVSQSTTMAAAPAAPFAQVNDFHKWEEWSPWAKLDPAVKVLRRLGVRQGAVFTWTGNDEVGGGKMTILESQPNTSWSGSISSSRSTSTNTTEFTFKPDGR